MNLMGGLGAAAWSDEEDAEPACRARRGGSCDCSGPPEAGSSVESDRIAHP